MAEAFLVGGGRTPFCAWSRGRAGDGRRGGALAALHPFDLGAHAVRGALAKTGAAPEAVERVVFSNVYADGPHACYGARYVALRAGLPEKIPSLTVAMACASGLYAVGAAAQDAVSGEAQLLIAGGADNASRQAKEIFAPSFHDLACGMDIGQAVEALAKGRGIGRSEMDRWAARSHERAWAARGKAAEEISAVDGTAADDAVMASGAAEKSASAKPSFGGAITAANTHAIADGAAAVVVSAQKAGALAKIASWAYVGVPPKEMGLASVPAVRKALDKIGRKPADVALWEINETFAAQVLMDAKELKIDEAKLNVNGGALAFGHPFAASGAKLVLGLGLELRRRGGGLGVAAICVGGGLGAAVVLESI